MSLFARHLSDAEIIAGIQTGGSTRHSVENRLYEQYLYFIREGTRKHRLPEEDCVSAYDDTILAGIDHITTGRFKGQSKLETYLYQIFSNKCVDLIRKKTTNREQVHNAVSIDDTLLQLPDPARTVVQQLIIQSDIEQLHQHLEAIGDKCRQMLLAWGEGYTDDEIAQQMKYNTASVAKTSRLRCLEKLRESYTSTKK
ncbi:RNA polymerase sigma factor [Spirosoma luteum]|uniref:RNA polymerase sigma factor n=1 Tax=Spirosoma luteum TaxID=431553 RepID=UPI00035F0028|nr:sigma-70 family RNA polymerase sigma factor [Spirosoma luteum]